MESRKQKEMDGTKWYTINKRLLPVKAFYFFCLGGVGDLLPYISLFMKQIGLTSEITGIIYGIMPFVGFLTRPIIGLIADKFQKHKLFLVMLCILTGIFYALMIFIPHEKKLYTAVGSKIHCRENDSYTKYCMTDVTEQQSCPLSFINYVHTAYPSYELDHHNESSYVAFDENVNLADLTNNACTFHCQFEESSNVNGRICFTNIGLDIGEKNCFKISSKDKISFTLKNVSMVLNQFSKSQKDNDSTCSVISLKSLEYNDNNFQSMICEDDEELKCDLECSMLKSGDCLGQHANTGPMTVWLFVLLFLFGNIFFTPIISLGDAMTYDILGDNRGIWGKQRLWGTIGFAVFAVSSTFIMDNISENPLLINYTVSFIIFLVLFLLTALVSWRIDASENIKCSNMFKGACSLFSYPVVVIFLCMQLLLGALQGVIETFLYWFLNDELNNNLQIIPGLCLLVSCTAEIPMLYFAGFIIKKIGHLNCIYLAFIAYGLRFFCYSLLTNAWYVLPVEVTHIFNYGLMWAAATSYGSIIAPEGMSATVQGLLGGLHFGCGKGIGSLVTGILYDSDVLGPRWTFRLYSILSVAFALIFFLINRFCVKHHPGKEKEKYEKEMNNVTSESVEQKLPLNPEVNHHDNKENA